MRFVFLFLLISCATKDSAQEKIKILSNVEEARVIDGSGFHLGNTPLEIGKDELRKRQHSSKISLVVEKEGYLSFKKEIHLDQVNDIYANLKINKRADREVLKSYIEKNEELEVNLKLARENITELEESIKNLEKRELELQDRRFSTLEIKELLHIQKLIFLKDYRRAKEKIIVLRRSHQTESILLSMMAQVEFLMENYSKAKDFASLSLEQDPHDQVAKSILAREK